MTETAQSYSPAGLGKGKHLQYQELLLCQQEWLYGASLIKFQFVACMPQLSISILLNSQIFSTWTLNWHGSFVSWVFFDFSQIYLQE